MLNLVYAIDDNYNIQTAISIKSFAENTNTKINIYILHKNKKSFNRYYDLLIQEQNIQQIYVFEFDNEGLNFPRIEGTHISEATYYRLYLNKYLPKDLKEIIYIDGDVMLIKNIDNEIGSLFERLKKSNFTIAAKTDEFRSENQDIPWDEIGMKSDKYFNAGVLFIDYRKWIDNKVSENLQNKLFEIRDELFFWDQDVLNSYFDGDYFELENSYNFRVGLDSKHSISDIRKNAFLIHYQGSWKPWSVRGCYEKNSIFYQRIYKKLNLGNYHLEHSWRIGSLITFLAGIFKFKFINLDYPYLFAKEFLISLSSNRN